jgi:hypothetical protein
MLLAQGPSLRCASARGVLEGSKECSGQHCCRTWRAISFKRDFIKKRTGLTKSDCRSDGALGWARTSRRPQQRE